MSTWMAHTTVMARPEAVLAVLTDPAACARWCPMPFDVAGLESPRLVAGSRARVSGRLAGREVGFDVEIHEADPRRMSLAASGPVALDVAYDLLAAGSGSEVRASIHVRPGSGLTGRLMAHATDALFASGVLDAAVARIAREAAAA